MTGARLALFRKKVRDERARDFVREAIRARDFTAEETLKMGLDLISFALSFREAAENAGHE